MSTNTDQLIEEALESAVALAFDGCHKIYILMDDQEAANMRSYGYGVDGGGSELVLVTDPAEALDLLREWWDDSCGLRFIEAVKSPGTNDDFTSIIPQFGEWVA